MVGAYALGYMLAVSLLATLTDRIDARLVLLAGSALSALATAAFGLFADGLWSAAAIWALAGIGFAGAYMPGLKALDWIACRRRTSRSITLYTSSFAIGVGRRSSSRNSLPTTSAGAPRSSSRRSGRWS